MGQVIPRSAGPDRIIGDYSSTLDAGRRSDDSTRLIVETRLSPLEQPVAERETALSQAQELAAEKEKVLLVCDGQSDLEVAAVLDEIWNALGRPAGSLDYSLIAATGKSHWTDGDPRDQPPKMTDLSARVRQATSAKLQEKKEDWAKRIDAKAAAQERAADELKAPERAVLTAVALRRAVADIVQVALVRTKRDLINAGLTERQIHEIIPDYEAKPRAPKKKPEGE